MVNWLYFIPNATVFRFHNPARHFGGREGGEGGGGGDRRGRRLGADSARLFKICLLIARFIMDSEC